jgi:L-cysteine:1D-myo-inositol 2-amino-2-deoxy-alpha-D-glucopyranoside ligase
VNSWPVVMLPQISTKGESLHLKDTFKGEVRLQPSRFFSLYVCGITPYDATHLGHASTYLAYDLVNRFLTLGHSSVHYTQNITDVDDPLLERAIRDDVDWKDLATSQIDLFAEDMSALRVLPPNDFVKVTDSMNLIIDFISRLKKSGQVYQIDDDLYFNVESALTDLAISQSEAISIFAERGGDPDRVSKKHPLDPLLWLGNKEGEPGWDSPFGFGRPGWHVECTAIALEYLDREESDFVIDMQGGGDDLIFPHHFMSATLIKAVAGRNYSKYYVHTGMMGFQGEKMSKSKGNLVLVSHLIKDGVDPMVIRWALMLDHYQTYREWSNDLLDRSVKEVSLVRQALSKSEVFPVDNFISQLIDALSQNLDTPRCLSLILDWAAQSENRENAHLLVNESGQMSRALDALLGLTF